jgi:hypothetical protein
MADVAAKADLGDELNDIAGIIGRTSGALKSVHSPRVAPRRLIFNDLPGSPSIEPTSQ